MYRPKPRKRTTQIISVAVFERSKGKAVPIRTESVCIMPSTSEPKIKMASRFNLDEKIVTKINVYTNIQKWTLFIYSISDF